MNRNFVVSLVVLIVFGVAGYLGYQWYLDYEVSMFIKSISGDVSDFETVQDVKEVLIRDDMPPHICVWTKSSAFGKTYYNQLYTYNRQFLTESRRHDGFVVKTMLNDSALYAWNNRDDIIRKVAFTEPIPEELDFEGDVLDEDCTRWTKPDESVFALPSDKLIRPYSL